MTSTTKRRNRRYDDEDEKMKRYEGVNALLNLARAGSTSLQQSPAKHAKSRRDDVVTNNNNNNCLKVQAELNSVTLVKEEPMDEESQ